MKEKIIIEELTKFLVHIAIYDEDAGRRDLASELLRKIKQMLLIKESDL